MPTARIRKLASLPERKAEFIEPMDCASVTKLANGPQWVYEIKLDGYRAIAVKADGRANLYSRRRKSFDHHYPLIVEALGGPPEGTVVDGEIVALDESGRPRLAIHQSDFCRLWGRKVDRDALYVSLHACDCSLACAICHKIPYTHLLLSERWRC